MNNKYIKEILILLLVIISTQVLSETRKIVAVVDTGLPSDSKIMPYLCKGLQFDVTDKGLEDVHGHGTNVVGIIAQNLNPKTHCISMIKWWHTAGEATWQVSERRIINYTKLLLKIKPSIVNLSLSGNLYSQAEYVGIKLLLLSGTKVVVAAGNDGKDLSLTCDSYPACYKIYSKNFLVVGAANSKYSNFKGPVTNILPGTNLRGIIGAYMSGTSQAASAMTSKLLSENN
jgi:subtilisin family serine protease